MEFAKDYLVVAAENFNSGTCAISALKLRSNQKYSNSNSLVIIISNSNIVIIVIAIVISNYNNDESSGSCKSYMFINSKRFYQYLNPLLSKKMNEI